MCTEMIPRDEIISERRRFIRENLFLTVDAIAELLCVAPRTVIALQTEGKLYRAKTGKNIVPIESFEQYRASIVENYDIE